MREYEYGDELNFALNTKNQLLLIHAIILGWGKIKLTCAKWFFLVFEAAWLALQVGFSFSKVM